MHKVVQAKLGEYRPVYLYDANDVDCKRGDCVILEVDRGSEYATVISVKTFDCKKGDSVKGKIVRHATTGDKKQIENNRMKAKDALNTGVRKITERHLLMKIVKVEYTFDNSKIIFFFAADGRVDFRALVKELAGIFRVRIELKQIGVRDKAKITGGYGVCGRELCCHSYMNMFHPLSVKMAKRQGLPLNPSRISGLCGRIKCCMAYEFDVYRRYSRSLPSIGDSITISEGQGRVVDINILKRRVSVDLGEGRIVKATIDEK